MSEPVTVAISPFDIEITKVTMDKIINALPENSITRGMMQITRNMLDKVLKEV